MQASISWRSRISIDHMPVLEPFSVPSIAATTEHSFTDINIFRSTDINPNDSALQMHRSHAPPEKWMLFSLVLCCVLYPCVRMADLPGDGIWYKTIHFVLSIVRVLAHTHRPPTSTGCWINVWSLGGTSSFLHCREEKRGLPSPSNCSPCLWCVVLIPSMERGERVPSVSWSSVLVVTFCAR